MKFGCPGCRAVFTIADEKIPQSKELRIACPKCGNAIELNVQDQFSEHATGTGFQQTDSFEADDLGEDIPPLEIVEEGLKSALTCIPRETISRRIAEALRAMDFHVSEVAKPQAAINRLRHNPYDLVVIDEASRENGLLEQINLLPMHVRRRFFLCLLSRTMPTLDQLQAFRRGVNVVLNIQDLHKAKTVLSRAIQVHEHNYRIFGEELAQKGQL